MGNKASSVAKCSAMVIGDKGAGKTSLIGILKDPKKFDISSVTSTTGAPDPIKVKDFLLYDISGGDINLSASVWKMYYSKTQSVIFVIDQSLTMDKIKEQLNVLESELKNSDLSGKPVAIVINKVDLANDSGVNLQEIASLVGWSVERSVNDAAAFEHLKRPMKFFAASAKSRMGAQEVVDWILDRI